MRATPSPRLNPPAGVAWNTDESHVRHLILNPSSNGGWKWSYCLSSYLHTVDSWLRTVVQISCICRCTRRTSEIQQPPPTSDSVRYSTVCEHVCQFTILGTESICGTENFVVSWFATYSRIGTHPQICEEPSEPAKSWRENSLQLAIDCLREVNSQSEKTKVSLPENLWQDVICLVIWTQYGRNGISFTSSSCHRKIQRHLQSFFYGGRSYFFNTV